MSKCESRYDFDQFEIDPEALLACAVQLPHSIRMLLEALANRPDEAIALAFSQPCQGQSKSVFEGYIMWDDLDGG